jgi:hypothetical protein
MTSIYFNNYALHGCRIIEHLKYTKYSFISGLLRDRLGVACYLTNVEYPSQEILHQCYCFKYIKLIFKIKIHIFFFFSNMLTPWEPRDI